jgi:fumarylpyruvate hydrolase
MEYVVTAAAQPTVEVRGTGQRFPVHRIYCVGRNYAAHAREMGNDPQREPPFFFMKPADAIVPNYAVVPYPPRTHNLHHEIELVIAIGTAGKNILAAQAYEHVYGYAVGVDLTRRDLQADARTNGRPWDTSKGFDHSAPLAAIRPVSAGGHLERGAIELRVNGELKQHGDVGDMIWGVAEIIAELSTYFELVPGDLIYSGTPAGVGALTTGDRLEGMIDGLDPLSISIA